MIRFELGEAIDTLGRTPAALDALMRGKPEAWLHSRIDEKSFSSIDVLGHLIFGEIDDWIPRARIILENGPARAFDPFDRRGFTDIIQGKSAEELLDQFADLRSKSLASLRELRLDDEKLDLPGMHPQLGSVTMRQLLAAWVVHDQGHVAQIMRILSTQYRDEVGPWREFLSIVG